MKNLLLISLLTWMVVIVSCSKTDFEPQVQSQSNFEDEIIKRHGLIKIDNDDTEHSNVITVKNLHELDSLLNLMDTYMKANSVAKNKNVLNLISSVDVEGNDYWEPIEYISPTLSGSGSLGYMDIH